VKKFIRIFERRLSMNLLIIVSILTAFLYSSTQALSCLSGDPCQLTGYFTPLKGYSCIQKNAVHVYCTCPGGIEENVPCRLCSRTNPAQNVCKPNPKLLACLEDDVYDTGYGCLCLDGSGNAVVTTNADCDTTVTLTTRATTTTTTALGSSSNCLNGGVYVDGICNCPNGYSGVLCADKTDTNLCEKIYCKNNGTCAIRNTNGPYEGVCLCRYGFSGEYCELIGTLGFCSSSSCMNGGACKENVIGSTRHAYCQCQGGFDGPKCENRYFICPATGRFPDLTNFNQGKYFDCTNVGGVLRAEQKSCPKGLRFNLSRNMCTY
jgi:hypothetical protein